MQFWHKLHYKCYKLNIKSMRNVKISILISRIQKRKMLRLDLKNVKIQVRHLPYLIFAVFIGSTQHCNKTLFYPFLQKLPCSPTREFK